MLIIVFVTMVNFHIIIALFTSSAGWKLKVYSCRPKRENFLSNLKKYIIFEVIQIL